jgi:hypothetical protein
MLINPNLISLLNILDGSKASPGQHRCRWVQRSCLARERFSIRSTNTGNINVSSNYLIPLYYCLLRLVGFIRTTKRFHAYQGTFSRRTSVHQVGLIILPRETYK